MRKKYSKKFKFLYIPVIVFVVIISAIIYRQIDDDKTHLLTSSSKVTSEKLPVQDVKGSQTDHIAIIVMENKSYSDIVDNPNAPFINSLIHTNTFSDNFSSVAHPSLPNYLALIGGSTFGITSDCTDCLVNATNLIDQLEMAQRSWKAYMESMPSPCFNGSASPYAQKHNPFIYFTDIKNDSTRCQKIVPFSQLSTDLQNIRSTPNFIWISPDLCHDMHNCSVKTGDNWLVSTVPLILSSPAFKNQNSLLVITWDESEGQGTNHIPTIFIGNSIKKGYITHIAYTHYSLLHTIEYLWDIPPLTMNVSQSPVITDVFK